MCLSLAPSRLYELRLESCEVSAAHLMLTLASCCKVLDSDTRDYELTSRRSEAGSLRFTLSVIMLIYSSSLSCNLSSLVVSCCVARVTPSVAWSARVVALWSQYNFSRLRRS